MNLRSCFAAYCNRKSAQDTLGRAQVGCLPLVVVGMLYASQIARRTLKDPTMSIVFNPLDHPDAEVSRAYFCQLTGRAKITAYRHERLDPDWPKPIVRGKRVFYKAADCKRYLESVYPSERPRRS
jgi:hypothetical protein